MVAALATCDDRPNITVSHALDNESYGYHYTLGQEYLERGSTGVATAWFRTYAQRVRLMREPSSLALTLTDPQHVRMALLEEQCLTFEDNRHLLEVLQWVDDNGLGQEYARILANESPTLGHYGQFMLAAHDFASDRRQKGWTRLLQLQQSGVGSRSFRDLVEHLVIREGATDLLTANSDGDCPPMLHSWHDDAERYLNGQGRRYFTDDVKHYIRAVREDMGSACSAAP